MCVRTKAETDRNDLIKFTMQNTFHNMEYIKPICALR